MFTEGIFGHDQFTGYFGMEHHYIQFMPNLSILLGMSAKLLGLGLWQTRFVIVVIGAIALALVYPVGKRLFSATTAILAIVLLLTWQVLPPGVFGYWSGVSFVDMARMARYDILVALWGLLAIWLFMRAQQTRQLRYDVGCGLCIGMAALSHIYGLFVGAGIIMALLLDAWLHRPLIHGPLIHRWKIYLGRITIILAATLLTMLPWLLYVSQYWSDFVAQQLMHPTRFDLLDPRFYVNNILTERHRYELRLKRISNYERAGFWLLLVGVPVALGRLAYCAFYLRSRTSLWLLSITVTVMALFALLIQPKPVTYLPIILTLLALAFANALLWLFRYRAHWIRLAAILLAAAVIAQGSIRVIAMMRHAAAIPSASAYFEQIGELVPISARVLGLSNYWYAVPGPKYRSLVLLHLMTTPQSNRNVISPDAALEQLSPEYILFDQGFAGAVGDPENPGPTIYSAAFHAYLEKYQAELIGTVYDGEQNPIHIYRLNGQSP